MRKVTTLAGAAVVLLVGMGAKGCGTTTVVNKPVSASKSSGTSATTAPKAAHVGDTLALSDGNGNKMNVTLVKIIDPAQGADQYTTPDTRKRFVGIELQLAGTKGTLSGDVNTEVSAVGSNNQTYTPDFDSIAGCTNFNDGAYTLTAGQSSTGCVTLQVPTGVTIVQVNDNPAVFGGSQGEWKVP